MNFAQSMADTKTPPVGIFTIKQEHWATGYQGKPLTSVKLGLRLLSDGDFTYVQAITKEAADKREASPEEFKRLLVINAVAVSICDPDDASQAHELFPCPDQQIPNALKPETITALFDECERLAITTSPIYPEASEDDLTALVEGLPESLDALEVSSPVRAARVRRLLRYCLDELTP